MVFPQPHLLTRFRKGKRVKERKKELQKERKGITKSKGIIYNLTDKTTERRRANRKVRCALRVRTSRSRGGLHTTLAAHKTPLARGEGDLDEVLLGHRCELLVVHNCKHILALHRGCWEEASGEERERERERRREWGVK